MAQPADGQPFRYGLSVIHDNRAFHAVERLKHQFRKAVQIGSAECQIDKAVLLHNLFSHSGFLDHTSAYSNHQVRPCLADLLQPGDIAEGTPFRIIPDTAGVEDHKIGFFPARSGSHPHFFQHAGQLFRVMGIHLAAVCHNIISFRTMRKHADFMHESVLAFNFFPGNDGLLFLHAVTLSFGSFP